jgi:hypothetical protein
VRWERTLALRELGYAGSEMQYPYNRVPVQLLQHVVLKQGHPTLVQQVLYQGILTTWIPCLALQIC